MPRFPIWTFTLTAIAVVGLGALLGPSAIAAVAPGPTTAVKIQEDDPDWNCATMGNKVCGPQAQVATAAASSPSKACHSAYEVKEYDVPEHIVKATDKHSEYTVYRHKVAAHRVKANC